MYTGAALAPMAPPSTPVQPPIAEPFAPPVLPPPVASPMAPQGATNSAVVILGPFLPGPIDPDSFVPMAPLATELPGLSGGGAIPGGPLGSVQCSGLDRFDGYSNFIWNPLTNTVELNAPISTILFTGGTSAAIGAVNGPFTLFSFGPMDIRSQSAMSLSTSGTNRLSIQAESHIALQNIVVSNNLFAATRTNMRLTDGYLQLENGAAFVYFTVNPNPTGNLSPVNIQRLPIAPPGNLGDVWNNNGVLNIVSIPTAESSSIGGRLFGLYGAIVSGTLAAAHWVKRPFAFTHQEYKKCLHRLRLLRLPRFQCRVQSPIQFRRR